MERTGRVLFRQILILPLVCLLSDGPVAGQQPGKRKPQAVIVATARLDRVIDRIEALGTTRANETVRVTTTVTEKIVKIHFDDGQTVRAGDVLVELETSEEKAHLRAAESVVTERRHAFERARNLESRRVAATAQLDERRAALEQAMAQIDVIKSRIAKRTIRAPFDGIVGLRNISVGALVEPSDLIATLDDLSVVKVDITVPTTYLATLRPGLPIVARARAFEDRSFRGEIRSVGTQVDPVTRSIVVRAILPNPNGVLRPGLLMTVELLKNERQSVVVPEEALIPRGRDNFVLVVDEAAANTVRRQKVVVGARRPGEAEIVSGLDAGAKVITHGTMQVRPGQVVTIKASNQPKPSSKNAVRPGADG